MVFPAGSRNTSLRRIPLRSIRDESQTLRSIRYWPLHALSIEHQLGKKWPRAPRKTSLSVATIHIDEFEQAPALWKAAIDSLLKELRAA